jgi:uncharacterized protein YndB with AHSA1/START domain
MTDLIEREMDFAASPSEVWEALTDPEWLGSWLADDVELELWPGGEARFAMGDQIRTGWVEEVSAPAAGREPAGGRLAFWWAEDDEPASRVELSLSSREGGTRLRVVETRPLQLLDLVGVPLPGHGGRRLGPALVAA